MKNSLTLTSVGGGGAAANSAASGVDAPRRSSSNRESEAAQQEMTLQMEALGRNIHTCDPAKVASKRRRKGECETCGVRLYNRPSGVFRNRKPEPLTIPGRVLEGRCLTCYPLDAAEAEARNHTHNHQQAATSNGGGVPQVLNIVDDNDNATVVSEVTVDHFFGGDVPETPPTRPQASTGSFEAMRRPLRPEPSAGRGGALLMPQRGLLPERHASNGGDDDDRPHTAPSRRPQQQLAKQRGSGATQTAQQHRHHHHQQHVMDTLEEAGSIDFDDKSREMMINARDDGQPQQRWDSSKPQTTTTNDNNFQQEEIPAEPAVTRSRPRHSIDEVATLVTQMDPRVTSSSDKRAVVVQTLTECIWDLGDRAKDIVVEANGLDLLATMLWEDMTSPPAARATATLLLSLVAESVEDEKVHVLKSGTAEGLMDAWLITMQSLIQDEELQEIGCRIFCCLASASSAHASVEINDGTLSGAVQSVLNAMDRHQESLGIQEWGIRALYNQCVYSRNAEPNKRTLASATVDSDGSSASMVLLRILERFNATDSQVEWCCHLYWVLSASADVNEMLAPAIRPMEEMTRLLRELHKSERYMVPVQEAILGALSNFAMLEQNRGQLDDTATVLFAYDIMKFYGSEVGILQESCYLIAALASGSSLKTDEVVDGGGVFVLLDMIASFRRDAVVREAALMALVALSLGSQAAKDALRKPSSLLCILQFSGSQKNDLRGQELRCTLLASICAARRPEEEAVESEVVEHLCFAMNQYPDSERLQDAGCRVIRNLSCYPENHDLLATKKIQKILIDAMSNFPDATAIHANTCCAFWNLKVDTDVQRIVTTLQNHLEDRDVVYMACGCLWSMVQSSDASGLKDYLTQTDGGIDAIACVLMMHPTDQTLLENVCGLLISLTVRSELVEAVVKTQGFHNMVDVMRSGNASVAVLRSGALFMRNVCLALPDYANEAASVIPAIVHAVQANMDDAAFQREACNFLWLVSTQSNESKSKILALDGVTMLMSVMEKYSGQQEVEEPALGAFRALTLTY